MLDAVMLYIAFAITEPNGSVMDEEIRVISRHFEKVEDCKLFIEKWNDTIKTRGVEAAETLLKEGYQVTLKKIGCTKK